MEHLATEEPGIFIRRSEETRLLKECEYWICFHKVEKTQLKLDVALYLLNVDLSILLLTSNQYQLNKMTICQVCVYTCPTVSR